MYITLRRDNKLLCDIDITAAKKESGKKENWWAIEINTFIDIQYYTETLLKIPTMFDIAQKEFISDFVKIQKINTEYCNSTGRFPEAKWYGSGDPQLTEDKGIIISEIRDQLAEVANKWGLQYNED